jgi:hypothetical protein
LTPAVDASHQAALPLRRATQNQVHVLLRRSPPVERPFHHVLAKNPITSCAQVPTRRDGAHHSDLPEPCSERLAALRSAVAGGWSGRAALRATYLSRPTAHESCRFAGDCVPRKWRGLPVRVRFPPATHLTNDPVSERDYAYCGLALSRVTVATASPGSVAVTQARCHAPPGSLLGGAAHA